MPCLAARCRACGAAGIRRLRHPTVGVIDFTDVEEMRKTILNGLTNRWENLHRKPEIFRRSWEFPVIFPTNQLRFTMTIVFTMNILS